MYYPNQIGVKHNPEIGNPISALEWYNKGYTMSGKEPITMDKYCVPCWSLAALLDVLPYPSLHKTFSGWCCDSYNKEGTSCTLGEPSDNLIDTCVDMIFTLKERNLI